MKEGFGFSDRHQIKGRSYFTSKGSEDTGGRPSSKLWAIKGRIGAATQPVATVQARRLYLHK